MVRKTEQSGHTPTQGLYGWVTHTELASADPDATRAWCAEVLGWTFKPLAFPCPPEVPGSIPYIHVPDTRAAFDKALREGAEEMFPPTEVMEGVTVAIVRAPGEVPIGFSGP